MIKEIHDRGWEIGLHASWYSYNDSSIFSKQKDELERVVDSQIISSRQHNLHFDIRYTPTILEQCGIKIDSSTQLAEEHPNTVASVVDIKTLDGRKFSGKQIFAKGDPNNRMTSGEIEEKFHKLSLPILGVDKAGQVAKKIINLEVIRDLDEITQMLR